MVFFLFSVSQGPLCGRPVSQYLSFIHSDERRWQLNWLDDSATPHELIDSLSFVTIAFSVWSNNLMRKHCGMSIDWTALRSLRLMDLLPLSLQRLWASHASDDLARSIPLDLYYPTDDLRASFLGASHLDRLPGEMSRASTIAPASPWTDQLHRWVVQWTSSMKQQFSPIIEPCSLGCGNEANGFMGESCFCLFTWVSCLSIPVFICPLMVVLSWRSAITHSHRRGFFSFFEAVCIGLLSGSLCNQTVSAFTTRPFSMSVDLRFLSMLGVQWIGFGLCLTASFICGVTHAIHYAKSNREGVE